MSNYARTVSGIYVVLEKIIVEAMQRGKYGAQVRICEAFERFKDASVELVGALELSDAFNRTTSDEETND